MNLRCMQLTLDQSFFWLKWAYIIKVTLAGSSLCIALSWRLLVSKGTTQITSVDSSGRNYIANAVCQLDFYEIERIYNQLTGTWWPVVLPSWHSAFITSYGWWSGRFWIPAGEINFFFSHKFYLIPLIFSSRSSLMAPLVMSRHSWRVFPTLKIRVTIIYPA